MRQKIIEQSDLRASQMMKSNRPICSFIFFHAACDTKCSVTTSSSAVD
jgi:hypothetical protein